MRIFGQILLLVFFGFGILRTARTAFLSAFAKSRQDSVSRALKDLQAAGTAPSSGTTESPDSRSSGGAVLKRPTSRALSAKETKRILDRTQHSFDQELSRITLSDAFDLADGGVLLRFENGKGRLYESKIEFRAMLDEGERKAQRGSESVCRDFPQGQGFADQVPQLVAQLSGLLKLDPADLDGSESSLDKVEKGFRRVSPEQLLTPEVFAPLTAYVGEVLRNKTNGRWEMRRATDAERTWEPWIVDPAGRAYAPFGIYKELLEYGRSASLRAFVAFPTIREGPQDSPPPKLVLFQLILPLDPEQGKIVTDVPFSATAVSETKPPHPNWYPIWQKTQSHLFRDSKGRIRTEETMFTSLGQSTSSVVIRDAATGTSFLLDPDQKVAAQLRKPLNSDLKSAPQQDTTSREHPDLASGNLKNEDLGTQIIAGITAQGSRRTITIPAGLIGNENSTAIVLETWYSNDLHILMMSKRSDPWSGETTYKVTNIQLAEPDPSLFEVPAGYTVR